MAAPAIAVSVVPTFDARRREIWSRTDPDYSEKQPDDSHPILKERTADLGIGESEPLSLISDSKKHILTGSNNSLSQTPVSLPFSNLSNKQDCLQLNQQAALQVDKVNNTCDTPSSDKSAGKDTLTPDFQKVQPVGEQEELVNLPEQADCPLQFSACIQHPSLQSVSGIALGSYKSEDRAVDYLVCSCEGWLTLWIATPGGSYVLVKQWSIEKNSFQKIHVLNDLEAAVVLVDDSLNSGSYKVYVWREDLERILSIRTVTGDIQTCCPLKGREFCLVSGGDIVKYKLSMELDCIDKPIQLERVEDCITSVATVQELPLALMGIGTEHVYLWNHEEGILLKKSSFSHLVPEKSAFTCAEVREEQGFLFFHMLSSEQSDPSDGRDKCPGYLMLLNPSTNKMAVVYSLKTSFGKLQSFKSSAVQEDLLYGILEDGSLWVWDAFSGQVLGQLEKGSVVDVTCRQSILAMATNDDHIHIFNKLTFCNDALQGHRESGS